MGCDGQNHLRMFAGAMGAEGVGTGGGGLAVVWRAWQWWRLEVVDASLESETWLAVFHLFVLFCISTNLNHHTLYVPHTPLRLLLKPATSHAMAHRRTVSSRHLDMGRIDFDQPPLTPPLHVLNAFNVSLPPTRKARHIWTRTTFLALFALLAIAGYVFFVAQPKLVPIAFGDPAHLSSGAGLSATERLSRLSSHARLAALRHKHTTASLASAVEGPPQIQLTQAQELAAVTSFIASLPQNVIPETVDPSQPVDPQLILDFDTRSPRAAEEVQTMVAETWVQYPVVFFSKVRLLQL